MNDKWIAITGTSSGIGRATALRLAGKGYFVLAGVRKQADFDDLNAEFQRSPGSTPGRLEPLMIDVSHNDSIAAAVEIAKSHVGSSGLYALVSNAGIAVPGPVEFVSEDDWRRIFDINFFGPIELTKRFLPLLRRGVEIHGRFAPRLVLVSSLGGRVAQPMAAPYTCSKFATTSLGDSLRLELHPQGIGVTIIEPGTIDTPIWAKGQADLKETFGPDHPAREHYSDGIEGISAAIKLAAKWGTRVTAVAERLVSSIERRRAPGRVLIGIDAHGLVMLKTILPRAWFDALLRRTYRLNGQT